MIKVLSRTIHGKPCLIRLINISHCFNETQSKTFLSSERIFTFSVTVMTKYSSSKAYCDTTPHSNVDFRIHQNFTKYNLIFSIQMSDKIFLFSHTLFIAVLQYAHLIRMVYARRIQDRCQQNLLYNKMVQIAVIYVRCNMSDILNMRKSICFGSQTNFLFFHFSELT